MTPEPRPRPASRARRLPALLGAIAAAAAFSCEAVASGARTRAAGLAQDSRLATSGPQLPAGTVAAAIHARLAETAVLLPGPLSPAERADLDALYEAGGESARWIDASGVPTAAAGEALALLAGAAADGLDPASYGSRELEALAARLRAVPPGTDDAAAFDVSLSAGVLRYFRHLHLGRVDPRSLGFDLAVPADPHDFVMLLRTALADDRIAGTAAELAPPLVQYRGLREALATYRGLAADAALQPPPPASGLVRPGERYEAIDALHRWLAALGDVPPDAPAPAPGDAYDGPIVGGVRRFQERHGLEPDGILGPATIAALRVPLAWRVRQIELALERLRWLPDLGSRRFVALNIPMFRLWMWDTSPPSGRPAGTMRAIVGRAVSTQTPVFAEEMQYVIFRPYWNVPLSIVRNEILPAIAREAGYLRRNHMEIVQGPGDSARAVPATADNLELLRRGALRLRQRPGPHNALGLVKFVFPNDESVYLHGTPAQELFSRARRDFSHGCVRVEDPVAMAEWALAGQPEWTREKILAAMSDGGGPQRVDLERPIQVILFYVTAAVSPEDGSVWFAHDIYGHDATLDRALTRAAP